MIAAIALIAGAVAAFFLIRRRKRRGSKGSQRLEDENDDPLAAKPEMDGQGKSIPIELFGSEGKLDPKKDPNSEFEMEGSKAHLEAKLAAEIEGSDRRHEMAAGGPSILAGRKVAEMEGEGEAIPPIEMYAGPQGLYELDSPVITPSTDARVSTGMPTPTSGGIHRVSDGAPSPVSPAAADRRRSSNGRISSWARRSKPVPSLPTDDNSTGEDGGGISSQDERSSITGPIWSTRRSSRPLGSNTAYRTLVQEPSPSRATTTTNTNTNTDNNNNNNDTLPAPVETARDRHRRGADALTKRLDRTTTNSSTSLVSASNYGTPQEGLSPTTGGSPRPYDSWNTRFANNRNSPNDMPSPHLPSTPQRERLPSSQSGWSGPGSRRPSDQSGLMSPVSPQAEEGPTGRIPSPRIPRSGGGRSPRPGDPTSPLGGGGRGGFF